MGEEDVHLSPEIQRLTEKLAKDPKSRLFAQLADAYRKCGMFEEAVQVCKQGLEHHPRYASAHIVLGRCYYGKGMLGLAKQYLNTALEIDPRNLVALALLGDISLGQGMRDQAVELYQRVIELDPLNEAVLEKLTQLTEGSGGQVGGPMPTQQAAIEPQPRFEAPPGEESAVESSVAAEALPEAPLIEPPPLIEPQPVPEVEMAESPGLEEPLLTAPGPEAEPAIERPIVEPEAQTEPEEEPLPPSAEPKIELAAGPEVEARPEQEVGPTQEPGAEEPRRGETLEPELPKADVPEQPAEERDIELAAGPEVEALREPEVWPAPEPPAAEPTRGEVREPGVAIAIAPEPPAEESILGEVKASEIPTADVPEPPALVREVGIASESDAESAPTPEPSTPEPVAPVSERETDQEKVPLATLTLAEIYAEQGFTEKALEIYRQLLATEPGNEEYRRKAEELTARISEHVDQAGEPSGSGEPPAAEAPWGEPPPGAPVVEDDPFDSMVRELQGEPTRDAETGMTLTGAAPERAEVPEEEPTARSAFDMEVPPELAGGKETEVTPFHETPPESVIAPEAEEGETDAIPRPEKMTFDMEVPPEVEAPAEPKVPTANVPIGEMVYPELEEGEAEAGPTGAAPAEARPREAPEFAPAEETIAFSDLFTSEERDKLGLGAEGVAGMEPAKPVEVTKQEEPQAPPAGGLDDMVREAAGLLGPGPHVEKEVEVGPVTPAEPETQKTAPPRRQARDEDLKRFQDWLNGLTK